MRCKYLEKHSFIVLTQHTKGVNIFSVGTTRQGGKKEYRNRREDAAELVQLECREKRRHL